MKRLPAYILAGGKSSRFGSDKARAELDGVSLIERIAATLGRVCEHVAVVADVAGKYADLGLPTITDRRAGCGPLAGLETALSDRVERFGPGWIILVSCDLAGLRSEWIETLACELDTFSRDQRERSRWSRLNEVDADDVAPRAIAFREERWQPFPAAYHGDLLPVAAKWLDAGRASFQRLLSDPRAGAVALPLPSDWPDVVQVNTRDDLERLRR